MSHRFLARALRAAALAAVAVVGSIVCCDRAAEAQDYCGPYSRPDLFYNYYVGPVPCNDYGAVGAQLYISPRPVPPLVGHTYITYQPLMPHEFLYHHHRTYYRNHGPHGGVTHTRVTWH